MIQDTTKVMYNVNIQIWNSQNKYIIWMENSLPYKAQFMQNVPIFLPILHATEWWVIILLLGKYLINMYINSTTMISVKTATLLLLLIKWVVIISIVTAIKKTFIVHFLICSLVSYAIYNANVIKWQILKFEDVSNIIIKIQQYIYVREIWRKNILIYIYMFRNLCSFYMKTYQAKFSNLSVKGGEGGL